MNNSEKLNHQYNENSQSKTRRKDLKKSNNKELEKKSQKKQTKQNHPPDCSKEEQSKIKIDKEKQNTKRELSLNIVQFLIGSELECLKKCVTQTLPDMVSKDLEEEQKFSNLLNKIVKTVKDSKSTGREHGKLSYYFKEMKLNPPISRERLIVKSLFLNVFSELDAFMGNLMQLVLNKKPSLLDKSEKQFSAEEVFTYPSMKDFREAVINKEIDTLKRKSYVEQFIKLENKFGMKLREFDNWNTFVEITQRRNIVMHCDGIVTGQYHEICSEYKCVPEGVKVGDKLRISYDYLLNTINIIQEVSIKLLHVVWRKLFHEEISISDNSLIDYIYDLLLKEDFEMAEIIGEFAYKQKNISSLKNRLYLTINYCIALKQRGKFKEIEKILNEFDWSTTQIEYVIAKDILIGNCDLAYKNLITLGKNNEMYTKDVFVEWPLFNLIRDDKKFKSVFKEIFEVDYDEYVANTIATIMDT